jgi:hypothetical protein
MVGIHDRPQFLDEVLNAPFLAVGTTIDSGDLSREEFDALAAKARTSLRVFGQF